MYRDTRYFGNCPHRYNTRSSGRQHDFNRDDLVRTRSWRPSRPFGYGARGGYRGHDFSFPQRQTEERQPVNDDGPPQLDRQQGGAAPVADTPVQDERPLPNGEETSVKEPDDGTNTVSPVNNKRVQDLLSGRNGPQREPQFDAFDSNMRYDQDSGPPHNQFDDSTPYCDERCFDQTPMSNRGNTMQNRYHSNQQFDSHNDKPSEYWARDQRGDWYPRSAEPPRSRPNRFPTYEGLQLSDAESVGPNTAHGRYLSSLLNRMTDRERERERQKKSRPAFPDDDESDTRSFHMSYTQTPSRRPLNQAPPPCLNQTPDEQRWREEKMHMHQRMQQLERELGELRNKQYETDHQFSNPPYYGRTNTQYERRPYDSKFEQRSEASRNIKFPRFKNKLEEYPAFKHAFMKCCKLLKYTDEEAQTQLLCCVEGGARNAVSNTAPGSTVHDMLHILDVRFGYNLSLADVANKLAELKRKSGETLHDLYDRVLNTVRCADMPEEERAQKARDTFFHALRTNRELQHYVGRNDTHRPPNIELTMALAVQYELDHGKSESREKVRQIDDTPASNDEEGAQSSPERVNQLMFTNLSSLKDATLKKLGKQQNEMVELFKKQKSLLEKHLERPSSSNSSRRSDRSSSVKSSTTTSSSKPRSTSRSVTKKTGKPWVNKKKKFNKSNKPKTTVNEIDAQPEEDGEEEAEPSGEEQASSPVQSDNE